QHGTTPAKHKLIFHPFSPTTGTCDIISPSSGPLKQNIGQKIMQKDSEFELEKSSRGHPPTDGDTDVLELFSKVEKSLGAFLKMRNNLKNIKTLEGSRALDNLFGSRATSIDFRAELQKTKVLLSQARRKKIRQ
ncbi:hypothetical protein GDO86_007985, partial [Hymenochirus boettgeri]